MKGRERRNDSNGRPFAGDRARMGYLLLFPFRDQKVSKTNSPFNNHMNCFFIHWNGLIQNIVPLRKVPSNALQLFFLEK
jgi:hypothetical protein